MICTAMLTPEEHREVEQWFDTAPVELIKSPNRAVVVPGRIEQLLKKATAKDLTKQCAGPYGSLGTMIRRTVSDNLHTLS